MNPKTKLKAKVDTKTTHLNRKSLSRLLPVRVVSNPDPVTPALGRVRFECPTLRRWSGSPDTHIYVYTYIYVYMYIYSCVLEHWHWRTYCSGIIQASHACGPGSTTGVRICSTRVLSGLGFTKPHGVMSEASPSEAKLAGSSPARVMLMPSLAAVMPDGASGQCHAGPPHLSRPTP